MELARKLWRTSLFLYKAETRAAIQKRCFSSTYHLSGNSNACDVQKTMVFSPRNTVSNSSTLDCDDNKPNVEKIHSALIATDELTSYIGLAREFAWESTVEHPYVDKLKRVQWILFDLNHAISKSSVGKLRNFETKHTKDLEEWTMEYEKGLPPAEDYIIPGGGKTCASLHVARSVCKRAERSMLPLIKEGMLDKEAQIYLNRLSDFLLTVSRIASKCDQRTENIYIPRAEIIEEK